MVDTKICFISMNLAGYPCDFSLSKVTIIKLQKAVSLCQVVVVGTQESSSETSFIDVLERDVLKDFTREPTNKKKIQSSLFQHLTRVATVVAENATWMFCAYKTPRIYVYLYTPSGGARLAVDSIQQYKCLRRCGFTIESGNIWKGANFLKIQLSKKTLLVVNTHLFYTSHGTADHGLSLRKEQFKKIMEWVVSMYTENTILVFMGDLNFRMIYPEYNQDKPYQTFIQQQSKKLTRNNDEMYTFLQTEMSNKQSTGIYTKIINGFFKDIPEILPLTCKRRSQRQDDTISKKYLDIFQIRTDMKQYNKPQQSKQRRPSNCDKILIHKGDDLTVSSPDPIGIFKVKNTDHCGVYRVLSIL